MSPTPPDLLAAALQLPVENRASLAEHLLDSLPDDFALGDEEAFVEELDLRFAEYQQNPDTAVSWDELKRGE